MLVVQLREQPDLVPHVRALALAPLRHVHDLHRDADAVADARREVHDRVAARADLGSQRVELVNVRGGGARGRAGGARGRGHVEDGVLDGGRGGRGGGAMGREDGRRRVRARRGGGARGVGAKSRARVSDTRGQRGNPNRIWDESRGSARGEATHRAVRRAAPHAAPHARGRSPRKRETPPRARRRRPGRPNLPSRREGARASRRPAREKSRE